jgi:hypothetical protein
MASRAQALLSLTLLGGLTLGIGGCSALDSLGLGAATESAEVTDIASEESTSNPEATTESDDPNTAELTLPSCVDLYSTEQTAELVAQERVNVGDTSEGVVGFGTTDTELVGILSGVRPDVRVSCTWYLPPESVSVTSIAIIGADSATNVTAALTRLEATRSSLGEATLWNIAEANSGESPDFIATESHLLIAVPCPSALAEEACSLWVTTNYTFGNAEPLTRDAAANLGVLG